MNPNIKRQLAILFLILLIPLTVVAVLGVWGIFDPETIWKSLATLCVVGAFLSLAITILSFVDIEQKAMKPKPKKKINEFYKDE